MKSSRIRKKRAVFDRGGDPNARMGGFGEGGFSSAGFDFTNLVDAMFGGSSPFGSGGGRGRARVPAVARTLWSECVLASPRQFLALPSR